MKKSLVVLLSVIVLVIFFGPVKLKANSETFEKVYCEATIEDEFIDNQILVVVGKEKSLNYYDFKNSDFIEVGCINIEDLTASRKEEVLARVNGEENNINLDTFRRILLLTLNKHDKQNVLDCIKKLEKRDDIKGAEPNYCDIIIDENIEEDSIQTRSSNVPSYTTSQDGQIGNWSISKISLDQAWVLENSINDLNEVNVVIIDQGVDAMPNGCSNHAGHPELIGVVDAINSEYFTSSIQLPSCTKCDYVIALDDLHGHGTFIAGIIGAKNDGYGIRGVSKTANIISYKYDRDGNADANAGDDGRSNFVDAIISASNLSGNVIIIASYEYSEYSFAEYTAISNFNGLLVCCAGNLRNNIDSNPIYPGSYDLDNIITVGASGKDDLIWAGEYSGSNYGAVSVDLFAPGEDIVSTLPYGASHGMGQDIGIDGYLMDSGTSYAAPYVAGVASMIWSRYPNLSALDVKDRILSNVDYVYDSNGESVFSGKCVTGGRLNAYKAYIGEHTHNIGYLNYDNNYHTKECNSCYYFKKEAHLWRSVSLRAVPVLPGLKRCTLCGAEKFV